MPKNFSIEHNLPPFHPTTTPGELHWLLFPCCAPEDRSRLREAEQNGVLPPHTPHHSCTVTPGASKNLRFRPPNFPIFINNTTTRICGAQRNTFGWFSWWERVQEHSEEELDLKARHCSSQPLGLLHLTAYRSTEEKLSWPCTAPERAHLILLQL